MHIITGDRRGYHERCNDVARLHDHAFLLELMPIDHADSSDAIRHDTIPVAKWIGVPIRNMKELPSTG